MSRWTAGVLLLALAGCYPKNWNRLDPTLFDTQTHPFTAGPYLVRTGENSLSVVIKHSLESAPELDYWLAEAITSTIVEATTTTVAEAASKIRTVEAKNRDGLWVFELENLPHDQPLQYRVRSTFGVTGPFTFKAGVSRNKPFRFAAFGDTRTGHQVHRLLIEAMTREQIDFVINSGDLVEFGGVEAQWDNFFRIEAPLISSTILFPVVGNHDDSPRQFFHQYFLLPHWNQARRYYVQDWGDVRFVAMDTQIEMRAGSLQYGFVENALREGAKRGQLLVLAMHYPPYSSGEHGSSLEVRAVVSELSKRFGVEVVLAGHDHDYERTKVIDGTTYIVAASAGATIRRLTPSHFTQVLRTEPHFVIFDVERGGLLGRTINLDGDTFDNFAIAPNPPQEQLHAQ